MLVVTKAHRESNKSKERWQIEQNIVELVLYNIKL